VADETHLLVLTGSEDLSSLTEAADPLAGGEAGARLHILGVLPDLPVDAVNQAVAEAAKETSARLERGLKERIDRLIWSGKREITVSIETGKLAPVSAQKALSCGADLLFLAVPLPGQGGQGQGGQERRVIRKAPCPVLIARPGMARRQVALAVDRPQDRRHEEAHRLLNRTLVRRAAQLAKAYGQGTVQLLHAWRPEAAASLESVHDMVQPTQIKEIVSAWEEEHRGWLTSLAGDLKGADYAGGVTFEPVFLDGGATEALPQAIERLGIGTLVLGTSNRTGLAGLFIGNVAERLIDKAACNLLVVKPEGAQELLQTMAAD
jgi:nucleotide-binding universal stress UspA family protein